MPTTSVSGTRSDEAKVEALQRYMNCSARAHLNDGLIDSIGDPGQAESGMMFRRCDNRVQGAPGVVYRRWNRSAELIDKIQVSHED